MIRIYDSLGRLKEEIDPSKENYCLHVSYVVEAPPYVMFDQSVDRELVIDSRSPRARRRKTQAAPTGDGVR